MAISKVTCANEMLTAFENAGKLTGMNAATKATLRNDWEFFIGVIFDHIVTNMVVTAALDTSLNTIFSSGAPAPTDGGAALQTAWKAATVGGTADGSTGGVS